MAQPPVPLTDAEKQWGTQRMRDQAYPEAKTDEFEWPEHQFDLGDVRVDARGRIYAFPYVPRGVTRERFVVDVFNAQGQPIFAGWMGLRAAGPDGGGAVLPMSSLAWPGVWKFGPMLDTAWQVSEGNAVYGLVINPDTEEWEVRRWRIVWPD